MIASSTISWTFSRLGWCRQREAGAELDPLGLPERCHRRLDQDAVRDQDPVRPADQRGVEEAELADHALKLTGQDPCLQPDALADAKRAIGDQHHAGEQVAEHLLGGEPDHDRGEAAPDGEGPCPEARDPQRDDRGEDDRYQPEQEADRPGRPGFEPPVEHRREALAQRPRERPAEDHEQDHRGDPDLEAISGEEGLALREAEEDPGDQRQRDQGPALAAPGGGGSISDPSPTSRQIWVRDSNAVRVRGKQRLRSISGPLTR